jgi:hypothetical protein
MVSMFEVASCGGDEFLFALLMEPNLPSLKAADLL